MIYIINECSVQQRIGRKSKLKCYPEIISAGRLHVYIYYEFFDNELY